MPGIRTESVSLVFAKGRFAHPSEPAPVVARRSAKGYIIEIGSGLYERAKTDGQIAFVFSHEMAHVVRGHLDSAMSIGDKPLLGGINAGQQGDSCGVEVEETCQDALAPGSIAEMEEEADLLGKQYAVKAGYGVKEAVKTFDLKDDWAWTIEDLGRQSVGVFDAGGRDRLARDQTQ